MRVPFPRALALACALLAAAACGDDGGAGASDAAPSDGNGGAADAEDLCDGDLTFEGHAFDLDGNGNLFDVRVSDRAAPDTAATSAPNGRVVLCLAPAAELELDATLAGYLARTDRVSTAAMGRLRVFGQAHPLGLFADAQVTAVAADLGLAPPNAGSTWVLVHVVALPGGGPLEGARVELDVDHGGAFARQADGSFVEGDVVAAGGAVLFGGVAVGTDAGVVLTPPASFAGACTGPSSVTPAASTLTGAAFVCE